MSSRLFPLLLALLTSSLVLTGCAIGSGAPTPGEGTEDVAQPPEATEAAEVLDPSTPVAERARVDVVDSEARCLREDQRSLDVGRYAHPELAQIPQRPIGPCPIQ